MDIAESVLGWLVTGAFVVLGSFAAGHALRHRARSTTACAATFGLLAVVAVAHRVNVDLGYTSRAASDIAVVAFAASGFAMLEFRSAVVPLPAASRLLAAVASAAAGITAIAVRFPMDPVVEGTRLQRAGLAVLVLVWVAFTLEPAWRFARMAGDRPPIERARLRSLAVGIAGVGVVLIAVLIVDRRLAVRQGSLVWIRLFVLCLLPLLYVAVTPPEWLRRRWLAGDGRREVRSFVPIGSCYWDLRSDLVSWSPEIYRLHGLDPKRFAPTSLSAAEFVHPDDRPAVAEAVRRCFEAKLEFDIRYRIVTVDGRIRWIDGRGRPVFEPTTGEPVGLIGSAQDVTALVEAETRLEDSRRELAEAQALAHLGSWSWDLRTGRIDLSDELHAIHCTDGSAPATVYDYIARIHPDDRGTVVAAIRDAQSNGAGFEHEYRIVRGDGDIRWLHARGEVVTNSRGSVVRLRGVCQDVTDRRRAEDATREALRREREAAERLRMLDAMKDTLLVAVSHELRTPLTVVLGLAQTLQRDEIWDEPRRASMLLSRLTVNAQKLERLVTDLLDLDRLQRGVLAPRRRPTNMRALAHRVVEAVVVGDRAVDVHVEDIVASVDPAHVERIIESLLANAARHTPAGTKVRLELRATEGGVEIVVEDTGPGVPDEIKTAIFEPFRQGDHPSHAPGTGIGLSLVARFAMLHGGRAWVEDRPGGGSSFRVFLAGEDELEIASRRVDTPGAAAV